MFDLPKMTPNIARTSVVTALFTRICQTHANRRIAIFAGPPGIGKTTALNAVVGAYPDNCAIATAPRPKCGPREILQIIYRAIHGADSGYVHPHDLKNSIYSAVEWRLRDQKYDGRQEWVHLDHDDRRQQPRFTIIIDEAQYLNRDSIETLRNMNDAVGSAPIPFGIVFVGNEEFALFGDKGGASQICRRCRPRAVSRAPWL